MRKLILVTALVVLASASAQAGQSRGLVVAAGENPVSATQPKAADAPIATEVPKADVPKFVERPAAVEPSGDQPKSERDKADLDKPATDRRADRRHHRYSIRTRVISELHRHGIYW
jgi:hypothetical protein